ncbi:MAG: MBL fold metallo-hydrolase [Candidatus Cloacimonetes bacterium]|nr:MBL fold metallo-hydrolase [Candidatus Cloacimonadota bacterium]
MQYKSFSLLPGYDTNTWLLWDDESKEAMLVDPSYPGPTVAGFVEQKGLLVRWLVNTHGHFDHIGGNAWAKQTFNAPLCIHKDDAPMLTSGQRNLSSLVGGGISSPPADRLLTHGDELLLGKSVLRVIHTPGHTRGGISLLGSGLLVSGDTLFNHSVGRCDLPGGDMDTLLRSICDRLLTLDGGTLVLPGHGPASTIEDEAVGNPFVGMMG